MKRFYFAVASRIHSICKEKGRETERSNLAYKLVFHFHICTTKYICNLLEFLAHESFLFLRLGFLRKLSLTHTSKLVLIVLLSTSLFHVFEPQFSI